MAPKKKIEWSLRRYFSPKYLIGKVSEKGLLRALVRLTRVPVDVLLGAYRKIRILLYTIFSWLARMMLGESGSAKTLTAIYDLRSSPLTFDIVPFLALADVIRRERNLEKICVVLAPVSDEGFLPGNLQRYHSTEYNNHDYLKGRVSSILTPCCDLLPAVTGVRLLSNRSQIQDLLPSIRQNVFPKGYNPLNPQPAYEFWRFNNLASHIEAQSFEAPGYLRKYAAEWIQTHCDGKEAVVIMLRECRYEQSRNSNIKAWAEFAAYLLDETDYVPVFIRDCEASSLPVPLELEDFLFFDEAIWSPLLRLALCEKATVTLSVSSGPSVILFFAHNLPFIVFKMLAEDLPHASEDYFKVNGLKIGDNFRWFSDNQRLVWRDDDFDVIVEEFQKVVDSQSHEQS